MNTSPIPWKHLRNVLVLFAPLWLGTTILFGAGAFSYSILKTDLYSARIPMVVRDEAQSSMDRLGRFGSQTELKAAQETILEMTQNPEVVRSALLKIGPEGRASKASWPSPKVVDSIANSRVNLVAPKGSDFGNSEVVYLTVEATSPERTKAFCEAMHESLREQLRLVRKVRADSLVEELTQARDLAANNLNRAARSLREIEVGFGTDLGELRNLNDTIAGDGTNRRTIEELTRELQTAELELKRVESIHQFLISGSRDVKRLLIAGSELFDTQPSLLEMKKGLIEAQMAASRAEGLYTRRNPKLIAALETEAEIRSRMQGEARDAALAMEPRLRREEERVGLLRGRVEKLGKRLDSLAVIRTDYAKVESDVKQRQEQLAIAEKALADAVATRAAALSTSLVEALGPPHVDPDKLGVGTTVMGAGGVIAGLMFGLGTVFLIAPAPASASGGRRWSDYLAGGRRSSDQSSSGPSTGQVSERRRGVDARADSATEGLPT
ncbi:MAG: hypothetical protein AAF664_23870 [Planctomycetota bacterium]